MAGSDDGISDLPNLPSNIMRGTSSSGSNVLRSSASGDSAFSWGGNATGTRFYGGTRTISSSPTSGGFFGRTRTFEAGGARSRRTLNGGRTLNRAVTWGGGGEEGTQQRPVPRPMHRPEMRGAAENDKGDKEGVGGGEV